MNRNLVLESVVSMLYTFSLTIQDAFRSAETVDWTVGGAVAGQVKSGGGLTFLAVEGAGHMVPMDQPANVRTLIFSAL